MKVIASTCVGTFTAPWLEYAIASIYNVVEEIIVVNGGYDIDNPSINNKKLERESKAIKEIDINGKITEVKADWKLVKNVKPERDTVAARNMSLGIQVAHYRGDAVLEIKCDQVFYATAAYIPQLNFDKHSGFQFWEYTNFVGNLYQVPKELKHQGCDDGARLFKSSETDFYIGQGQPMIKAEQFCIDLIQTGHMRYIYPDSYSDYEKFRFAYERAWAHLFCQNSINEHPTNRNEGRKLTIEEIEEKAKGAAEGIVNAKGVALHLIDNPLSPKHPPPVCLTTPLRYIKKGYPK